MHFDGPYHTAEKMLAEASDDFDVDDCFEILRAFSKEVCPTVVSMVFDVAEMTVYWCENRHWDQSQRKRIHFGANDYLGGVA